MISVYVGVCVSVCMWNIQSELVAFNVGHSKESVYVYVCVLWCVLVYHS